MTSEWRQCTLNDSLSYFLFVPNVTHYYISLCESMWAPTNFLNNFFLHLMLIPVVLIILITILTDIKGDYKWFILHTALLDMIAGICWECLLWFPYFLPYTWIYVVLGQILNFSIDLAVMSALPLAVDRFLSLYYPTFEKTNIIIFLSIFIYDIITAILIYVANNFAAAYVNPAYTLLFMIITVGILLSVFAKIRTMIKLAGTSAQQSTLRDLRRAAIVCLVQTLCLSTHLSFYLYNILFVKALRYDPNLSKGFLIAFIIIDPILNVMFQFFVIVDCLSKLIVLKAYRSPVEKFCMYVVNFFFCGRFGAKKIQKKRQTGMNYPAADKS